MKDTIRIGTMAGQGRKTPEYISAILPHGFESFQLNFWQTLGDVDLPVLADQVQEVLEGHDAVISSLAIFGNPLETEEVDLKTLQVWEQLIDHAHLFGTDLVCGFAGRLRNRPIGESIPRFKEVFGDLARRAADRGVRLAFENCSMDGTWKSGDWNIAVSPEAWEMMFNALPEPHLGLEWEPCHQWVQLIDPIGQLRKWAPKVFHIHGKDASVYHDVIREDGIYGSRPFAHHRHPGFGDSNWTDIISILRGAGFEGSIDIEGWHDPVYRGELEMTGQVRALQYLKTCRGTWVDNPKID